MNKKLFLLLVFPIYLKTVNFENVKLFFRQFLASEMFSERGDRWGSDESVRQPSPQEKSLKAYLAAEERRQKALQPRGEILDSLIASELWGETPLPVTTFELKDFSSN